MPSQTRSSTRGKAGRVLDVRFMEVEFEAPRGTRMVIELEGGLRLLVADDRAVELAARLIAFLRDSPAGPRNGGRP
jgi:hypothetical protein